MNNNSDKKFTQWEARPGFLILLPSRTSPITSESIVLPETATKKENEGICIKAGMDIDWEVFGGKECLFPNHAEFRVKDTDTGYELYIVAADKVIMFRQPPPEVFKFSREKGSGMPAFMEFATTHEQGGR
jgi:hypothetical protein